MPTPIMFDVEASFNEFADKSAMAEANRFKTVPTGTYKALVTKREGQYYELRTGNFGEYWAPVFSETEPTEEQKAQYRKGVRLNVELSNGDGRKLSTARIEASWEAKRDPKSGKLDKLFTRWNQLTRAVFPNVGKDEVKSTGDVLSALSQYPVKVRVTESFKVPAIDGSTKWVTPENDEQAKEFREAGYEVRNFVQSVSKY